MNFHNHKSDTYSQAGEDGVIAAILAKLGKLNKWCVEFGAWDGTHLSNTRNLIDGGYSAVLIEGDKRRYGDLTRAHDGNSNVFPVNAFVGFEQGDGLDTILAKTPIPQDFDFCSIDIDGNDYYAWRATSYRPKLVCIEFNPTIPTECSFVQPADPKINQGASLLALTELAKTKGYELAHALAWNAFFVRSDLFPLLGITDNRPQTLRTDTSFVTHFFYGFDGQVFIRGNKHMVWHRTEIKQDKLQVLPRVLRTFPVESYSIFQRVMRRIYRT